MTKKDLTNGDIIVTRGGFIGVVLKGEDYILYQEIGIDDLDEFNDDLTFKDRAYRDGDIMAVFNNCSFIDIEEEEPIWERTEGWHRPCFLDFQKREEQQERARQNRLDALRKMQSKLKENSPIEDKESIFVISQFFYGNRTGVKIDRARIAHFLRGDLSDSYPDDISDVILKTVHIPSSRDIVIVYDQTQEDQYVNIEFPELLAKDGAKYLKRWGRDLKMHVSCEIPELGFKIHTRCIACRVDNDGVFQNLENCDIEKFIHYFPA